MKASAEHNVFVDSNLDFKDNIPDGSGRRLETVGDAKRHGMVSRFIEKLSTRGCPGNCPRGGWVARF
jgi:hypothetical protein